MKISRMIKVTRKRIKISYLRLINKKKRMRKSRMDKIF